MFKNVSKVFYASLGIIVSSTLIGCATWYPNLEQPSAAKSSAKLPKTPQGHISLQTIFLRLENEDRSVMSQMWSQLDEVSVDFQVRRELEQNGIRCGTVNGQLPIEMQRWVTRAEQKLIDDPLENIGLVADVKSYSEVIYCKSGADKDIVVKPTHSGSLVIMHRNGGGMGRTFESPQLMFKLRGRLKDNGSIGLQIEPVVEHGQFRNSVMGQDFALRREVKRDTQYWPNLRIDRDLRAGQVLVLSCTDPPVALGKHFFMTQKADDSQSQLVLLVRIDKSQTDSAFVGK